jgi:hypothetical protein
MPAMGEFPDVGSAEPGRSGQRLTDMKPIAAAAAGIALIAGLGACGSETGHSASQGTTTGHSVPRGAITGLAMACAGPPGARREPVTVFAWRDNRIITTQVVHLKVGGGRYRLMLPPGRYLIGARGSGADARLVMLHPRQTVTVNFPSQCY